MIELINPKKSNDKIRVFANDAEHCKYYGAENNGSKSFLCRQNFGYGNYHFVCVERVTMHNEFDTFARENINDAISAALENRNMKVFEFNKAKELMAWLAS
jgi:hypothetical protein